MGLGLGLGLGITPSLLVTGAGGGGGPNPNLLLWSEAFDNAVWAKTAVVVTPDATNDPNAELTAELVNPGDEERFLAQVVNDLSTDTDYTLSFYAKLSPGSGGSARASGQIFGSGGGILVLTSEWQRATLTVNSGANTSATVRIFPDDIEGSECYLWGAKLEEGSTATDYVKREGT